MPRNTSSLKQKLFALLTSKGFDPTVIDINGKEVSLPEDGEVFQFHFRKDDKDYGSVTTSVDGVHKLMVYFNTSVTKSPKYGSGTWYEFLKQLKQFALKHQLAFELKNIDKLRYDMKRRDSINEAYTAVNKKTSHNDGFPTVKLVLQHNKPMQEGEQRFRHVEKIYLESENGERFLLPTTNTSVAKVYARHCVEGGNPYDSAGNHITQLVDEYTKLSKFIKSTKKNSFKESTLRVIEAATTRCAMLRENLSKLIGKRGYREYFANKQIPLFGNESNTEHVEKMFDCTNEHVKSAMPIIAEIIKTLPARVGDDFDEWTEQLVNETIYPANTTDIDKLKELIGRESDEIPYGVDGQNAINMLNGILEDDTLNELLTNNSNDNPDADARLTVLDWLEENQPTLFAAIDK